MRLAISPSARRGPPALFRLRNQRKGSQAKRVIDVAGLREKFDGDSADGLAERGRGRLKCRKTAVAAGFEFRSEHGQNGAVKHRREGLRKAIDR